ncbi:hypothetical protein Tco_0668183 [Tanacetum coccineum]
MSVQTRYSVVDDETRQGLKEEIVKLMRDELGIRNEMRDMMFDEMPIRNNLKQVMVKEPNEMIEDENVFMNCEENIESKEFVANDSNEVIDNEIDKEVLNEASKACDERKGFESKKSSDVDNDYNYFVGCGKIIWDEK